VWVTLNSDPSSCSWKLDVDRVVNFWLCSKKPQKIVNVTWADKVIYILVQVTEIKLALDTKYIKHDTTFLLIFFTALLFL
jgi:hypothetical protein